MANSSADRFEEVLYEGHEDIPAAIGLVHVEHPIKTWRVVRPHGGELLVDAEYWSLNSSGGCLLFHVDGEVTVVVKEWECCILQRRTSAEQERRKNEIADEMAAAETDP